MRRKISMTIALALVLSLAAGPATAFASAEAPAASEAAAVAEAPAASETAEAESEPAASEATEAASGDAKADSDSAADSVDKTREAIIDAARSMVEAGEEIKIAELFKLLADWGDAEAQDNPDDLNEEGSGDEEDYRKALEYFQEALDEGSEYARVCIGYMYENGWAVEQSLEKAVECYREAADNGEEAADEQLDRLVDEGKLLAYVIPDAEADEEKADESQADEEKADESKTDEDETDEREWLCELNRKSIANLNIEESPVYVIGHCSPDSDTVCSAITYARILTMLGYPAEAAISAPVNRETAYILKTAGVEAPPVLEDASGKSIFLVDHSEYAQAVEGMKDAHIVGILDHHGVGSVTTGNQVVYEAKPIGATATIIWLDYLNYGLEIDKTTATLLLGAILSDTANLTVTSVTETDRQAVSKLAESAEITDVNEFYRNLHSEALSYEGMSNEEIFFSDYKEYEVSGVKFGIGMVAVIDEDHAKEMAERMKEALPKCLESSKMDLLYAEVGIREGDEKTDYIVSADGRSRDVFEAAFPKCDEFDGTSYIFRNGGLGRKSKLVPGLTDYLNAHPRE